MFEISANKGLCDVILGSEVKTSDLAAHFPRNSGAANTVSFTIQTFNEHSRMGKLSQPYLRGHMKRHKIMSPMLRNRNSNFGHLSTFKSNIFSTRKLSVLTDTVIYLYDQHLTWQSQLKPNAKVG